MHRPSGYGKTLKNSLTRVVSSKNDRHRTVARSDGSVESNSKFAGPHGRKLRSSDLKPEFGFDEFTNDALCADAVAKGVAKRSRLRPKTSAGKDDDTIVGGRLLLYKPSENLACAAAEASSNGFFHVNNVLRWEIWVDFSERTLVSWVAPALVDVAQMGIDVNPEECIRWAQWDQKVRGATSTVLLSAEPVLKISYASSAELCRRRSTKPDQMKDYVLVLPMINDQRVLPDRRLLLVH